MKIRTLLLWSTAIAVAVALIATASVWRVAAQATNAEAEQETAQATARDIASLLVLTQEYVRGFEGRAGDQWRERFAALSVRLRGAPAAGGNLLEAAARLPELFTHLTELAGQPQTPFNQRRKHFLVDQLLTDGQLLADGAYRWSHEAGAAQRAAEARLKTTGGLTVAIVVALLLGQVLLFRRRVLRPLAALEAATGAIEAGNLTVRIGSSSGDELGALSRRFDAMAEALRQRTEQLDGEIELRRRSERQMRAIADNIPALVMHVDRDERYTFSNAAHTALNGNVVGKTVREAQRPEHYEAYRRHMAAALGGERVRYETTRDGADGERHFDVDFIPDVSPEGQVEGFYSLIVDITGRKHAELQQARSEERLRSILTNAPDAFISIDEAGRLVEWNSEAELTFGWTREEVLGRPLPDVLFPARLKEEYEADMQIFAQSENESVVRRRHEVLALHKNGNEIPVELSVASLRSGGDYMANCFLHDISERKAAEAKIAAAQKRLRDITDNIPALIAYFDRDMRFQFANRTFAEWAGFDTARLIGTNARDVLGPVWLDEPRAYVQRAMRGEKVEFDTESHALGVKRHLRTVCIPDVQPNGEVAGLYTLTTDVTAMKLVEQRLEELALVDSLTGLPNRRQFERRLEEALERGCRSGRPMALMFLDVDHFKEINDGSGHGVGDEVLRQFAQRLLGSVRAVDTVARLAGDEFVVILEDLRDSDEAATVAAKIGVALREPIMVEGRPLRVTSSIGVAFSERGSATAKDIVAKADEALYRAKRAGRNTFALTTY
jgi:diguanylate cyclase (GGDEF)-like protein/PAS domain S-box-containing protein